MALRKSELYSSLWSSCDELSGGMDASQCEDYVLVTALVWAARQPGAAPNTHIHLTPWAVRLTTLTRIERPCESQS